MRWISLVSSKIVKVFRPDGRVFAPDTGSMRDEWVHIGRLWTNGENFLAVDASLRGDWRGGSDEDNEEIVLAALRRHDTSVPVGTGRALLVGADTVRADSWMEVFEKETGLVAIVVAEGTDYPEVLARALSYPVANDLDGDTLKVPSGEIAIFSHGLHGTGPDSQPFDRSRPGPVPPVYRPSFYGDPTPSGLLIPAQHAEYKLKVRRHTWLDEDNCFARWLLIPSQTND